MTETLLMIKILMIKLSDRLYSEDELPPEFKLFLPIVSREKK